MSPSEWIALALMLGGAAFYLAGTVGLLRFPDVYCRLHALTKADNLGLLLICAGLAVLDPGLGVAALLVVIWLLGLLAATVSAHLIARHARHNTSDKTIEDQTGDTSDTGSPAVPDRQHKPSP